MRLRGSSLGLCTLLLASPASAATTSFSASPNADAVIVAEGQEKPVSPGAQVGMVLAYDDVTNIACGHVTWSGLSGKPTAIHVHIGAFDKNTTVRYAVPVPAGDGLTGDLLFRLQGNADFGQALKNAGIYGDVHTVKYPSGEVRDTFLPEGEVTADCGDSPLLGLEPTSADAGADASTPTPTPTATTPSSPSGPEAQPGRTAPTTEDEAAPADGGGCNVATGTADLSLVVLAGIGVVVARRKRRRIV